MTIRSASLIAAALLAASATSAFAQDYDPRALPPLPDAGQWDEYGQAAVVAQAPVPAMGYSAEQRAAWLDQCRANYYEDDSGRRSGEAIGAVTGAIAGGVIGSEIDDGDDVAGTLIGAGVGGLAGAVVGGEIGGAADRDQAERRLAECEAYLAQYEQGYAGYGTAAAYGTGSGVGYHYPYPYPVMWVRVPIVTERRDCGCEEIVEGYVEERPAPPPRAQPTKIRRIAPAPAPDKRVKVRRVK